VVMPFGVEVATADPVDRASVVLVIFSMPGNNSETRRYRYCENATIN
jgi:hypothetical protein